MFSISMINKWVGILTHVHDLSINMKKSKLSMVILAEFYFRYQILLILTDIELSGNYFLKNLLDNF